MEEHMQLEDYFDFSDYEKYGEIRIQGHRLLMQDILFAYLRGGHTTPQELLERFPSMTMDEILAVLLYHHTHEAEMVKMLDDVEEWAQQQREKQKLEHPEWYARIQKARAELTQTVKA